ncbi:uncharacterized protein LOC135837501 isoform X2 [Planococcus citri]|uniref:uncharacterized protein LOC135837501 isoform X2 n=1 Tax=Planococcus citri TaxID=170843 RepID=UPI0031F809BF
MANIGQHYCLRWNNYQSNMTSVFYQLLRTGAFVDVTLTCNENSLKAHKVVLSACSSYFQKLLTDNPCKHPTIILPQEVGFNDLKFIIDFVYRGEINVSEAELQSLLKTADHLKIKGLCEVPEGEEDDIDDTGCGDSVTDVSVLGAHMMMLQPDKSSPQKHKILNKLKPTVHKFAANIKRKHLPQDVNSSRKYFIKDTKPNSGTHVDQGSVQLIQASTINPNDILDTTNNTQQYHNLQPAANCITVATSTEEDDKDKSTTNVVILDNRHQQQMSTSVPSSLHYVQQNNSQQRCQQTEKIILTSPSPMMTSCTTLTTLQPQQFSSSQPLLLDQNGHHLGPTQPQIQNPDDNKHHDVEMISEGQPPGPTATPVHCHSMEMQQHSPTHRDIAVDTSGMQTDDMKVKFETLRTMDQTSDSMDTIENHMSEHSLNDDEHTMQTMMITPELLGLIPSTSSAPSSVGSDNGKNNMTMSKKDWTQDDMDAALDALRNHNMSLTKASITFGIPSTTLWQRAHRLGIDTPKKDGPSKSWNEDVLNVALDALRTGSLSANKASKAYGIPSSTLYKIARREGIRLAAPFNAAPTAWTQDDLERALEAIRTGQTTVQKAATEYGIPTGTLYGRCKREKIELSRSNPTPWSQDAMSEALDAIRLGQMSINQASIHYNLPYSSLYGRFRRGKYEADHPDHEDDDTSGVVVDVQSGGNQQQQMVQQSHSGDMQQSEPSSSQAQQQSALQPQIMLLQYQHTPATHIQMYQPAAPS